MAAAAATARTAVAGVGGGWWWAGAWAGPPPPPRLEVEEGGRVMREMARERGEADGRTPAALVV